MAVILVINICGMINRQRNLKKVLILKNMYFAIIMKYNKTANTHILNLVITNDFDSIA